MKTKISKLIPVLLLSILGISATAGAQIETDYSLTLTTLLVPDNDFMEYAVRGYASMRIIQLNPDDLGETMTLRGTLLASNSPFGFGCYLPSSADQLAICSASLPIQGVGHTMSCQAPPLSAVVTQCGISWQTGGRASGPWGIGVELVGGCRRAECIDCT